MHGNTNTIERVLKNIKKDGCWLWQGTIGSNGYGKLFYKNKHCLAHRLFYEKIIGPIDKGFQIDHLCRVRNCVNPLHLEMVTPRENILRGNSPTARNKRKRTCLKNHPLSGSNLYVTPDNRRQCKSCGSIRSIIFVNSKEAQRATSA